MIVFNIITFIIGCIFAYLLPTATFEYHSDIKASNIFYVIHYNACLFLLNVIFFDKFNFAVILYFICHAMIYFCINNEWREVIKEDKEKDKLESNKYYKKATSDINNLLKKED